MAARKTTTYPIEELSLNAIRVDHAIQSRVSTSIEYQREFSEAMLRGEQFPPVTVFIDEKGVIRLADGFHRFGAARKAGMRSIRAEVRPGGQREAIVFSAGANIKFSIPRTREDIDKAIRMLLNDKEWFEKPAKVIASYVGCAAARVTMCRATFCLETGRSMSPEPVARFVPSTRRPEVVTSPLRFLKNHGFEFQQLRLTKTGEGVEPYGHFGHGVVWEVAELATYGSLARSVGNILLARTKCGGDYRAVLVHAFPGNFPCVVGLAQSLGVEFLTRDELLASLAPELSHAGDVAPP